MSLSTSCKTFLFLTLATFAAGCGSGYENGNLQVSPGKKLIIHDREGAVVDFASGSVELSIKKPLFSDYRIRLASATQEATIQVDPDLLENGTENFLIPGKEIGQEFDLKGASRVYSYSEPAEWNESCSYICGYRDEYRCRTACWPTCSTSCRTVCRGPYSTDCHRECYESCSNQCHQNCGWETVANYCSGQEHHTGVINHTVEQFQVDFLNSQQPEENIAQIYFPEKRSSSRQSYSNTSCR